MKLSRPSNPISRSAFTLIELLIVIAIIAILSVVVLLTLNPAELLRQSRDTNRIANMQTVNNAVALAQTNNIPLGIPYTIYISIPDPTLSGNATSTCAPLGLPTLPSPWVYNCVSAANVKNIDGTGWMPIPLNTIPSGSPLAALPTDSTNNTSTYLFMSYATDGTHYEFATHDESQKYTPNQWIDGGRYSDLQETGTDPKLIPVDLGGGNIYLTVVGSGTMGDYTSNGHTISQFGASGSGNGQVNNPNGIATDQNGDVYIVDTGNSRIEKFSPNGTYISQFGASGSGNGQFKSPYDIAIDASGNIYVSDAGNNRIEEFDSNGDYKMQFAGSGGNQLNNPTGIAIDASGTIYVSDSPNNRIEEFHPDGSYYTQFGSLGSGVGEFNNPVGLAFDQGGDLYIVDYGNYRVQERHPDGTYGTPFGSAGAGLGQFAAGGPPRSIAVDRNGNIYVPDFGQWRVEEFSATGTYMSAFYTGGNLPYGIAIQQ